MGALFRVCASSSKKSWDVEHIPPRSFGMPRLAVSHAVAYDGPEHAHVEFFTANANARNFEHKS